MKLLILGNFGKGALENFFVRGLKKENITVEQFDITSAYYEAVSSTLLHKIYNKFNASYFYKPVNKSLLQFIDKKKYDVILVFKGLTLFPETIEQLKLNTILLCCYNPDHPFTFYSEGSGNKNIVESITHYHIYFSYAERITSELKKRYDVASFTVPFGYDESEAKRIKQIIKTEPSSEYANRWLFIGAYDRRRSAFLAKAGIENLSIYGEYKWRSRNNNNKIAKQYYQGRALYDDDYYYAISQANGIINLLREQNLQEGSHNMRTFEVPGNGGLLVADRTEEQMQFFEDEKEAIYFEDIDEFRSRLKFLGANPAVVEKIKLAARKRCVDSGYSYDNRCFQLAAVLKQHLG